jgi:hypothetical protein
MSRQVVMLKKNRDLAQGSGGVFLKAPATTVLRTGTNRVEFQGIEALSGLAQLRFSVARHLAAEGVFLLGAYEDGGISPSVVAYLSVMEGPVTIQEGNLVLKVESIGSDHLLVQEPESYGAAEFKSGVMILQPQDGKQIKGERPTPSSRKKPSRRKKS